MLHNTYRTKYGFTLIELMVVVTIIGILTSAGILVFTNAQQNARDKARIADVHAVAKLMEQYYQENGEYFDVQTNSGNTAWVSGSMYATLTPYLSGHLLPQPPTPTYLYAIRSATRATSGSNTSSFCTYTGLENLNLANCTAPSAGVYTCPFVSSGGTRYCVQSRQ